MPPSLSTTLLNTITSHTGPINALTFSSQGGTYILSGSSDRSIHLSRTIPNNSNSSTPSSSPQSSSQIQKYSAHGYPILSLSCSPSNTTFASSGGDRSVFLWDVTAATTIRRFGSNTSQSHTAKINTVTFAGDGGDAVLISGSDDTSVRIWDVRSKNAAPVMVLTEAKDAVSSVTVNSVNEVEIVAGSVDGRVRSYDVRTGRCTVDRMSSAVAGLCLTRDGRAMAVGTLDDRVRLLDRGTGRLLQSFPKEQSSQEGLGVGIAKGYMNRDVRLRLTFGLREEVLMSGSEADGKVHVWDVMTGRECASVEPSITGTVSQPRPGGYSLRQGQMKDKDNKAAVVSVVEWRGKGGLGNVWACGGVEGKVWVYGNGNEIGKD